MRLGSYAKGAAATALLVVVAALVVGQLLGQPILLGYVATDSMEPTMDAGDGFIAIPSPLAGDVSEGDVVVFEAEQLHGGGLTTHRVVGETDRGYVTKGDANPFTDQDGGEPPVSDQQIVAEALQINGEVVVIPHLGTAVMGIQSGVSSAQSTAASAVGVGGGLDSSQVGGLLVALGLVLLGVAALSGARGGAVRDFARSADRPGVVAVWSVAGTVAILIVLFATAAMVVPSGTTEYGIVSAEQPADDPLVIEAGGSSTVEYPVTNGGVVPVVVFLETGDGAVAEPDRLRVGAGGEAASSVTLNAPESEGQYDRYVTQRRYLLLLPPGLIAALHAIHPTLALLAVDAVVVGVGLSIAVALFGTGDLRLRSGADHVSLSVRLRRKLRKWL
ncbi:signal peptidase I [Natronoarchaeum mannanilyticum]|uniref:Signal peptidase I n=1 Tax=Natronoarchaeum mannanilyticum TaxID=926360 RepID=A0AAV3T6V0_9EURY